MLSSQSFRASNEACHSDQHPKTWIGEPLDRQLVCHWRLGVESSEPITQTLSHGCSLERLTCDPALKRRMSDGRDAGSFPAALLLITAATAQRPLPAISCLDNSLRRMSSVGPRPDLRIMFWRWPHRSNSSVLKGERKKKCGRYNAGTDYCSIALHHRPAYVQPHPAHSHTSKASRNGMCLACDSGHTACWNELSILPQQRSD